MDRREWTHVEFVRKEMLGRVIGRSGSTIRGIEEEYNVYLKVESDKLYILGTLERANVREALDALKELVGTHNRFKEINKSADDLEEGWEIVPYFDSSLIGMVIGKQRMQLRRYEKDYQIEICVVHRDDESSSIAIKGDNDVTKRKFKMLLRRLVVDRGPKRIFCIGESEEIDVILTESCSPGLYSMQLNSDIQFAERRFDNIPDLRETLMEIFENAKEKMNTPGMICDYIIHCGKMFSRAEQPGEYPMKVLIEEKALVYQRLEEGDLNLEMIGSMPKEKEIIRYDFAIYTPDPPIRICYEIFLAFNDPDGRLDFIRSEEAGVVEDQFYTWSSGPGYFKKSSEPIGILDIVDPSTSHTTRITIQLYNVDCKHEEKLMTHVMEKQLSESFFQNIQIKDQQQKDASNGGPPDLDIPELPTGYELAYLRKSVRSTYRFSERNLLVKSKEFVFVNDQNLFDTNGTDAITDVFFDNTEIKNLLGTEDWEPQQAVGELMENALRFRDILT